jgi:hypothetical protein
MSWVALQIASTRAARPTAVSWVGSLLGRSRAMAAITATSTSCISSSQPRRRSGHGIGQRSSSGAQNSLRV